MDYHTNKEYHEATYYNAQGEQEASFDVESPFDLDDLVNQFCKVMSFPYPEAVVVEVAAISSEGITYNMGINKEYDYGTLVSKLRRI